MDIEDLTFDQILGRLLNKRGSRDPRARRLASVSNALVEVVSSSEKGTASCTPARLYAQGMTALEGTVLRTTDQANEVNESLGTQVALLDVLSEITPFVEPVQIVVATLAVPSRILRNMVSFCQSVDSTVFDTEDELGGVSAVLRSLAKTCSQIVVRLRGTKPDEKVLQQLWRGTILVMVTDPRPKVRKAAINAALEVLADGDSCLPLIRDTTEAFLCSTLNQARKHLKGDGPDKIGNILPIAAFLERSIMYFETEKVLVGMMELLTALLQSETEAATGSNATTFTTDFVAITKHKKRTDRGIPVLVINALMGVIKTHFEESENSSESSQFASRVVATLLTAQPMWIFRPGMNDLSTTCLGRTLWGQVMIMCCKRILDDESQMEKGCKMLPIVVKMVLLLAKPSDEAEEAEAEVAFRLFVDLTKLFRECLPNLYSIGAGASIHAVCVALEQVLQPVFRPSWAVSLKAFAVCLQYTENVSYGSSKVDLLIQKRLENSSNSVVEHAIDDALSTLVQNAGLEKVWSWIVWPDSSGTARMMGWLLSVLRVAGQTAQPVPMKLAVFQDEILVLARRFDKMASSGPANHKLENRMAVIDTWKLLTCFLHQLPPDISERLPSLTTTIAKALEDERYPELTPVICQSILLLAKIGQDHLEFHRNSFEDASSTLLPLLFKISMATAAASETGKMETENSNDQPEQISGDGQKLHVLGQAISSLCCIADRSFLQGLFKKLMHRLLEEIQLDSPSEDQLTAYLSLSQSLVVSGALDQDNVAFLFRAIKPLLRDGQHGTRSLKRAYKLLSEICEKYSSFFSDPRRLEELSNLVKETAGISQVAARYMRLKCISRVVESIEENTTAVLDKILSVTPEILLCLKDSNAKTRDAAYNLILAIAAKSEYKIILRILSASLASETPHMRSATVMALSRVVYELAGEHEDVQASLPSLLATVLCLLTEESREVIKSVVGFIRVCVTVIPKEQLKPLLPQVVGGLLSYHKVKERFRRKIKIILKKLVKRFGYDALMPHVPQSESRLLTHMRKVDERMKRRKTANRVHDTATKADFDDFLDSEEEDSDNGRTLVTTIAGDALTKASWKSKRSRITSTTQRTSKVESKMQLPSEADGNIVDMLGSSVRKKVSFAINGDSENSSDEEIEFDDDGMMIIHEVDEDEGKKYEAIKKRRLNLHESVTALSHKDAKKSRNKSSDLGRAYKSRKAGGDVKRKQQKYEPYAFVPLNAKSYSKKHRKHAVESMSSVVRKGKK